MKNLIIVLVVLAVVGVGAYYLVFNDGSGGTPTYTPTATNGPNTNTPVPTGQPSMSPTPTATPAASASSTPKVSKTPVPSSVTVSIKNFAFSPSTLTIKKGTKVTWVNNDTAPHTVTSDLTNYINSPTLDSPTLAPGQSFSLTFTGAGTTNYHCAIHPAMKGSVVVTN